MPRLLMQDIADAAPDAAPIFTAIKAKMGVVPNAYRAIGSSNPGMLDAVLQFDQTVHRGTLTRSEIELIKLVVSELSDCDYCLSAHTFIAKKLGLSREAILAARYGLPTGESRADCLVRFVRLLMTRHGVVPRVAVDGIRGAGFSDAQIIDVIGAITSITFTNLFNRVNDTPLDFPPAD